MELKDFRNAEQRIREYVNPSPLIRSNWLSQVLEGEVYLKLECLQPGRSFKIRGATNALLSQEELPNKTITASGGNHGLGVAIASSRLEVPCTVVLPTSTSSYRVELLQQLGAEVELHGDSWDDANTYALKKANQPNVLYIHPFADMEVIEGQGTISLELLKEVEELDTVIASVGGGGLLGGIALALESAGREDIEIVAVETAGADSMIQSLNSGKLVELEAITSIAKTLGARKTTPYIFHTMQRLVNQTHVVNDRDAIEALFSFLDHEKILVEPATSCSISALLQNRDIYRGKRVAVIICGSNVTYEEALVWQDQFLSK